MCNYKQGYLKIIFEKNITEYDSYFNVITKS
jgi:hypothetical protein